MGAGVAFIVQFALPRIAVTARARMDADAAAADAAYNARMKTTTDKFHQPASLPRDCPQWTDKSTAYFCWEGDGDPVDAAVAFRDSLDGLSATSIDLRCWQSSVGRVCQLRAVIDGRNLDVLSSPPMMGATEVGSGVRLQGMVLEEPLAEISVGGTPVAVPD